MTEPAEPTEPQDTPPPTVPADARSDPRLLRASDTDRNKVAEALHEAAGEGRLTLDELQERLDATYAAKTYADLEPVLSDLPSTAAGVVVPVGDSHPATRPSARVEAKGEGSDTRFAVAVLSGAQRKGAWLVPRTQVCVAVMGGVEIDLREARFSADEVTIQAYALMGGVEVTVPEWMEVHVDGFGLMGGFDDQAGPPVGPRPVGGGPVVRFVGFALMGGVSVRRRPPKPPKGSKRRKTS